MKKITEKQKNNAFGILDALSKSYIISPELRIGIVCVAAKESGLIPRRESNYAKTSNERIRKIFGKKKLLGFYDDYGSLSILKSNSKIFFNFVYRDVAGNRGVESGDGYNYRGGGYNQLTGHANYRAAQNATGWALVDRPSLITWPECAADVLVAFFERALMGIARKRIVKHFQSPIIALDASEAVFAASWNNAGIEKKPDSPAVQRAYKNALEWLPTVQALYQEWSNIK